MKIYRSYQRLVNEIINLKIPFRIEIVGYISYEKTTYPMLAIRHIVKTATKNVVILAGQHGDEFFGVHILLKWLQQFDTKLFNNFNITIFPVINPWGYQYGERGNALDQDTNDEANFKKDSEVKELAILFDNMPLTTDMVIDIHGDVDKQKAYAYERKLDTLPSLAEISLFEAKKILPFETSKTIYKLKVNKGVIKTPACDEGIETAMEKMGTEYTITIELPGKHNSQKRTEGGIAILNSILKNYKDLK
jgi:predicted deacylase